ncbi:MAG TPA: NUDIX hydrolase [Acidimicrobiales bacterium]|nr:NUDIX hydrolase [Acidimicrobiales bacterium]
MPEAGPGPAFRRLSEATVFDGALISVASVELEGPGGDRFEREVVHHPGAVVVVPVTSGGRAVMVRQYRAAVQAELLEVPAGKRDVDGEPTEETARRELIEEVGRRAGRLDLLARFYNSPGFTDEFTWLYLARDLEEVPHDRQGFEEMAMSVEEVDLADVPELIRSGAIRDAKSIIGLCLAREVVQGGTAA